MQISGIGSEQVGALSAAQVRHVSAD